LDDDVESEQVLINTIVQWIESRRRVGIVAVIQEAPRAFAEAVIDVHRW
jgi:hypothetical protein